MSDNLDIWNKLGKTAPEHTKKFQRAGGFKGTAIKPIYTEHKMTEVFGPAGKGWGMGEPKFEIVPGSEGQVAVFCTVALWWAEELGNSSLNSVQASLTGLAPSKTYGPPHTVYGVGGDMVVVKQSSGLRTDDEAFKKAFTDAVGNAMKHLGMSADVHMGLFDDSKYVQEREREERSTAAIEGRTAPNTTANMPMADDLQMPASGPLKSSAQAKRDGDWEALTGEVDACSSLEELNILVASKPFLEAVAPLPNQWKQLMRDYIAGAREGLGEGARLAEAERMAKLAGTI